MKVFRGSQKGKDWSITDEKPPEDYIKEWEPGRSILFDATIDKKGTKHSLVGISINEDDVICLFNKLIEQYKNTIIKLEKRLEGFEKMVENRESEIEDLREVFRKLDYLTSFNLNKAPSNQALIEAVQNISEYYTFSSSDDHNHPTIEWIEWESL